VADLAYLGPPPRFPRDDREGPSFMLPDIIVEHHEGLILHPVRGAIFYLAAFNEAKVCLGWVPIESLGFQVTRDWIAATNYTWDDTFVPTMRGG